MLVTATGTGVSSYARQLERAHLAIGGDNALLADRADLGQPAPAPFGRAGRWLRALIPGARQARQPEPAGDDRLLFAPDIFRLAQVYFDIHRCPLPVRLPGRPGIMHWTYPVPMTVVGWRNLYTVHDVIPLLHPELTDIDGRRYRRLLDRLGKSATRFIAVSGTARDEIIRVLGCPPPFVIDCGLAVDATPAAAGDLPAGLMPGGFLLVCGTVERRKNVATALAAYRLSGVTIPLVIAGPDGWGVEDVAAEITATPGVIRLPYLDRAVMRALIGHARALLMPSLAEGFGLPVAEAMALGVPVATSDKGALAETAGGAALLVDPGDISGLAAALRRLSGDDAFGAMLARAGLENAKRFTPDRFAERLTRAYGAVMADGP
ncbi:glycosyltransferase family 4 protein [Sphingomonas crusticola]|uniref:glycosyltransferase family 4 protein n=1 Tax=Sphingomonas crusticola TaxID=1697973 RepID=UPI0013C3665A|nr:glycosyltransferase family 1 protein [Sphingomonas crusticola]